MGVAASESSKILRESVHIARSFGFRSYDVPVFGMLVTKRHVRKRFSFIREQRLALDGPLRASVEFSLRKALPDKIAGRHGYGKRNVGKERRGGEGKRSGSGRARNADFVVSVIFKPLHGGFDSLERVIVMAVIFFAGRHGKHVYA